MFAGVLPKRAAPVGRDDQRERISRADADLHVDARGSLQEAGAATRWRSICRRIHLEASFAKPHIVLRQSRYPLIDADDDSVATILPPTLARPSGRLVCRATLQPHRQGRNEVRSRDRARRTRHLPLEKLTCWAEAA